MEVPCELAELGAGSLGHEVAPLVDGQLVDNGLDFSELVERRRDGRGDVGKSAGKLVAAFGGVIAKAAEVFAQLETELGEMDGGPPAEGDVQDPVESLREGAEFGVASGGGGQQ